MNETELVLLSRLILTKTMMDETFGSRPSFLKNEEKLWNYFRFESKDDVVRYHENLLADLGKWPRVQDQWSRYDWYLKWKGDKYYIYRSKGPLLDSLDQQFSNAMRLWPYLVAAAIGGVIVAAIFRPDETFAGILSLVIGGVSGFISLALGAFVHQSLFNAKEKARNLNVNPIGSATHKQEVTRNDSLETVVLFGVIVLALVIAISAACLTYANIDKKNHGPSDFDPYDGYEQTYPW